MALSSGEPLTEESVRRLRVLQRYLREQVKPEEFNIDYWYTSDPRIVGDTGCGTVACALGHACMIPEFQAAGLKLWDMDKKDQTPCYAGFDGTSAGGRFFDLMDRRVNVGRVGNEYGLANALFMPHSYNYDNVTPEMVAKRIDEILDPDCEVLSWPSSPATP